MATTLVIKNANFAANKVDTVVFADIPCTGVSLSDSTASLTSIGATKTLTATLTPADTTDVLHWSTSDSDVATVVDGVVTATGLGSATITATCGNYSATCVISVAVAFDPYWTVGKQYITAQTSTPVCNYIGCMELTNGICAGALTGTYPINNTSEPNVYPYKIPNNAVKIRVQATNYYIGIAWSNLSQTEYNSKAIGLGGNAASSSAGIADDETYTVPSGVDSFALTIRRKDSTAATESDINNVTVTFLTE